MVEFPVIVSTGSKKRDIPFEMLLNKNFRMKIDPYLNIECIMNRPIETIGQYAMAGPAETVIIISGNGVKHKMQSFDLKRRMEGVIVTRSLSDLEQLYQAITNGETFILACDGHAEVITGAKLITELEAGNITLKAEYIVN